MLSEITWTAHPVIFQVGWFALRWYALMFIVGFFIGIKIMEWIYRREGLDPERVYYLFLATFIGTIIGARLGHCFFYDPDTILLIRLKSSRHGRADWPRMVALSV